MARNTSQKTIVWNYAQNFFGEKCFRPNACQYNGYSLDYVQGRDMALDVINNGGDLWEYVEFGGDFEHGYNETLEFARRKIAHKNKTDYGWTWEEMETN